MREAARPYTRAASWSTSAPTRASSVLTHGPERDRRTELPATSREWLASRVIALNRADYEERRYDHQHQGKRGVGFIA